MYWQVSSTHSLENIFFTRSVLLHDNISKNSRWVSERKGPTLTSISRGAPIPSWISVKNSTSYNLRHSPILGPDARRLTPSCGKLHPQKTPHPRDREDEVDGMQSPPALWCHQCLPELRSVASNAALTAAVQASASLTHAHTHTHTRT